MLEIVGTLGATLLALCPIPQTIQTLRTNSANDISWPFLLMWFFGEVLIACYVLFGSQDKILLFNYMVNLLCLIPILWVKIRNEYYSSSR